MNCALGQRENPSLHDLYVAPLPKTSIWRRPPPPHSTVAHLSDWTGGSQWQQNTFNHWAPPAVCHPERNPSHSSEWRRQHHCFVSSTFYDLKKKSTKTNLRPPAFPPFPKPLLELVHRIIKVELRQRLNCPPISHHAFLHNSGAERKTG